MPDQFAHYDFARRVWQALPQASKARVNVHSAAFRAGTFGPDPLFNEINSAIRHEGFAMHKMSGCELMQRMRAPVKRGMKYANDYAAGFFCHYALDRICHPEILRRAARGDAPHVAMEAAYDRILLLREGETMPRRILLTDKMCEAAAQMYQSLDAAGFRAAVNRYWQLRRMMYSSAGKLLAPVVGVNPNWRGIVPYREAAPILKEAAEAIDACLKGGVILTAAQLERWFYAVDHDLDFDPWLNADFSGNMVK